MPARDLIDRFGREEDAFLRTEFVAPVTRGAKVRVRIAGIVCELSVRNPVEGISVLRPCSHREAEVLRPASKAESKKYLDLFPRARLVATFRHEGTWLGLSAGAPEKGVRVEGFAPIALAPALQQFETAAVRFDGGMFLHESSERPADAAFLRGELAKGAESPVRKGLTAFERAAYAAALAHKREMEKSVEERRLEAALRLAGASLEGFSEQHGVLTVRYLVDGVSHSSTVTKDTLEVVSSGICVSGQDRDFDLTSLVSVMREHRGMEEE
jgi:hypothetical protein